MSVETPVQSPEPEAIITSGPERTRVRAFSADEFEQMILAGIFRKEERIELLEGQFSEMTPIGGRHHRAVSLLNAFFAVLSIEKRAIVSVQGPLRLGERSVPEPDVVVLKYRPDFYPDKAGPQDVLLLVEVGDTSAEFDRRKKLPLYAMAGIVEVWLIDLNAKRTEVYRDPDPGAQRYTQSFVVEPRERIVPSSFASLELCLSELFT